MDTGTLTPRCSDPVRAVRFSGPFGQPDGFSSVLTVIVRKSGDLCLKLNYKGHITEHQWAVELTSEQRIALGKTVLSYTPKLYEDIPL
jgi:hypothetical protein